MHVVLYGAHADGELPSDLLVAVPPTKSPSTSSSRTESGAERDGFGAAARSFCCRSPIKLMSSRIATSWFNRDSPLSTLLIAARKSG